MPKTAKGKEYELAIRISGIVDKSFNTALVRSSAEAKKFSERLKMIDADFTKMDKAYNSVMTAGKRVFGVVTSAATGAAVAIGAATAASVSFGSKFESSFAGVKKTVEATRTEYAKLRRDILGMTKEIPASADEIAGVMEIAGQLGIPVDSLSDFTRSMINIGVSTNLSAADAATNLARFANITNLAQYDENGVSNYDRLGSAIVDLGNNFATTEEEIVMMATNLAATGDIVGLTQAQTLALATAMSAVGIRAEKGGTAMSKLLRKMQLSVETGNDMLEGFAAISDMTTKEFVETFENDAVVALGAFLQGLNDTERNGMTATAALVDMGLSEVRLTDVILRLANAQGELTKEQIESAIADEIFEENTLDATHSASLMTDAINLANKAWADNTALAIESGKRYETFESQVTLLKNAFKNLAIAGYDNASRTPVLSVVQGMTRAVNEFTDSHLDSYITKINEAVPTLERKTKNAWKVVQPVVEGGLNFGKFLVSNGDYVISALVGIGSTMATYKIASSSVHLLNAIMGLGSMNPVVLGVMGVATAVGAVVTALGAYKAARANAAESNLIDHFGNIALSMADIQRIASDIVNTKSLERVNKTLQAFGEADRVMSDVADFVDQMDFVGWKVSVGLKLTDEEKEDYQYAVTSFISGMNEWLQKEGYGVQLNMASMFGASDTSWKVNQFYLNAYSEMEQLGKDLSDAVNKAFADGILDPEEADYITQIQRRMSELQASLATGDFEASLIKMQMEYGGGAALTADSFRNLQTEIEEQAAIASDSYMESYARAVAAINHTNAGGGFGSDAEYQEALKEAEIAYLNNMAELLGKSTGFQVDAIMNAYSDSFDDDIKNIIAGMDMADLAENGLLTDEFFQVIARSVQFSNKDAIEELLDIMSPSTDQLKELADRYAEVVGYIPDSLAEKLRDIGIVESYVDVAGGNFWKDVRGRMASGPLAGLYNVPANAAAGGLSGAMSALTNRNNLYSMGSMVERNPIPAAAGNTITYSPTLQFYGDSPSKSDVTSALSISQSKFNAMMDNYTKQRGRVSLR